MWALIQGGAVYEVTEVDPAGRFHPDLLWKSCGEEVKQGWLYDGETFVEPVPDDDYLVVSERAWRDQQLSLSDGVVTRHRDEVEEGVEPTLTAAQYLFLQAYRRQLRNWPEDGEFPLIEHRPSAPEWLVEQAQ